MLGIIITTFLIFIFISSVWLYADKVGEWISKAIKYILKGEEEK